jgi:hypothetical protein
MQTLAEQGFVPRAGSAHVAGHAATLAVLMSAVGLLLCGIAIRLGVGEVAFTGVFNADVLQWSRTDLGAVALKQVGYLWAPNWSLFGVVVLPIVVFFGLQVFLSFERTLRALAQRHMIRRVETFQPATLDDVLRRWRRGDGIWRAAALATMLIGCSYVGYDGWKVVGEPMALPGALAGVDLSHPVYEFDWSIACLFAGSQTDCGALQTFSLAAYALLPGTATVLSALVAVGSLRFMAFVAGSGGRAWALAIDPTDSARRRFGWGAFAPLFSSLACWAILMMFGLWLMVVQNVYLRDPNAESLLDMLAQDWRALTAAVRPGADGLGGVLPGFAAWALGDASRPFANNWQTGLGVVPFACVVMTGVIGSAWLLHRAGRRSWEASLQRQGAQNAARLPPMNAWPVSWIGGAPFFMVLTVMCGALFSYRLMLVAVAMLGVSVVAAAIGGLRTRKP